MNSAVPMATAGSDETDRVPKAAAIDIELSPAQPSSHANFTPSSSAMNGAANVAGEPLKSSWVQFDDEDDDDKRSISPGGVGAGSPSNIPIQSAATAGATNRTETVASLHNHHRSQSPAQNNNHPLSPSQDIAPAVLATESVHVNLNNSTSSSSSTASPPKNAATTTSGPPPKTNAATPKNTNMSSPISIPPVASDMSQMRTIELSTGRVREGFANGDVIVTLLPINTKWPWITPAVFRPELVPEELMAQGLTLTVEEYVNAMETLVNDYRFTLYNICYKRVLVCWILFAFCVLLALLFSGLQGIPLFSLGVGWLFLNAAAIFLCMWVKLRLSRGLEKCLARVNKQLARHKILLVLDDRGRISCHKVNLCFLYFDPAQCVAYLNSFIDRSEQNGSTIQSGWEARMDLDVSDIVIQGSNPTRVSRKQAIAQEILLSYLQRWGKDFLRRRLDWTVNEDGTHEMPRHLMSSICPCQYVEEILNNKIKAQLKQNCCGLVTICKDLC